MEKRRPRKYSVHANPSYCPERGPGRFFLNVIEARVSGRRGSRVCSGDFLPRPGTSVHWKRRNRIHASPARRYRLPASVYGAASVLPAIPPQDLVARGHSPHASCRNLALMSKIESGSRREPASNRSVASLLDASSWRRKKRSEEKDEQNWLPYRALATLPSSIVRYTESGSVVYHWWLLVRVMLRSCGS